WRTTPMPGSHMATSAVGERGSQKTRMTCDEYNSVPGRGTAPRFQAGFAHGQEGPVGFVPSHGQPAAGEPTGRSCRYNTRWRRSRGPLVIRLARRPGRRRTRVLVAMAGLPGSGKSTLAACLERELGAVVLDKDRVRAALFPPRVLDYSAAQDEI